MNDPFADIVEQGKQWTLLTGHERTRIARHVAVAHKFSLPHEIADMIAGMTLNNITVRFGERVADHIVETMQS